jgi:trk system potassium uptake protein TrkH
LDEGAHIMQRVAGVLNILGLIILIFASLMLFPTAISWYLDDHAVWSFVIGMAVAGLIGLAMWAFTRQASLGRELRNRDGFLLSALTWMVLPGIATIPLMLSIPGLSFTDAYFETMSGLTTTGATTLSNLDQLPSSINVWRTFLVWLGGMGVVVLAVAVLPMLGVGGSQAFKAETPGPMKNAKLTPRIAQTAKGLWLVYLLITIACTFSLWAVGMPFLDSMIHTFTIMGLGGFSSHDASFGFFDSPAMEAVAIVFMLLAAINFSTHFLAFSGRSLRAYVKDNEAHMVWITMIGSVILVAYFLWAQQVYPEFLTALRHSAFNVVSIATTTGLATQDYNLWPAFAPVLMLFLSCFATAAGSTGGGIKMVRAQLLVKHCFSELHRLVHPKSPMVVKLNGVVYEPAVMDSSLAFMFLYGISIIVCTLLMLLSGCELVTALSAVVASINNMGPGLNLVGPATTFAVLTDFQTWICTLAMLLGRLELFTMVVIFTRTFWRT